MSIPEPPGESAPREAEPPAALYRKSHPVRAFVIMTLPFTGLVLVVAIPFIGWVVLFVLLPIEFGRIGGRRLARNDALWVAAPAAAAVATYELALIVTVLKSIPGTVVELDALGFLVTLVVYGLNLFFFSVGALSTAFDPKEPIAPDVAASPSP